MNRFTLFAIAFAASITFSANSLANPVDDMLASLRSRSDVTFENQGGWTIASTSDGLTLWSFTPVNHPANPAYVQRQMLQREDGAWYIEMDVKCGAAKAACDELVADFQRLNEQLRNSLNSKQGPGGR